MRTLRPLLPFVAVLWCAAWSAPASPSNPPFPLPPALTPDLGGDTPEGIAAAATQAVAPGAPAARVGVGTVIAVRLAGLVGVLATLLAIGAGLVLFARPQLETISDTAMNSLVRSFLVGLVGQLLIVPTFAVVVVGLALSVVGILLVPFAAILSALLVLASVVGGFLGVAHALGERHTRRRIAQGAALSPNSFRYLLVGLGAAAAAWLGWALLGWVPVADGLMLGAAVLATWVLGTVGLGAFVLSRGGLRPTFAGRLLPPEMLTDEYLWATPRSGVAAVRRPT